MPADYDGDGRTDIAVWQSTSGKWSIKRSSDSVEQTAIWGTVSAPDRDLPVVGDYDGDGKADLAVFRSLSNRWQIKLSSDETVVDREWGSVVICRWRPITMVTAGQILPSGARRMKSLVICSGDGRERGYSMDVVARAAKCRCWETTTETGRRIWRSGASRTARGASS